MRAWRWKQLSGVGWGSLPENNKSHNAAIVRKPGQTVAEDTVEEHGRDLTGRRDADASLSVYRLQKQTINVSRWD